MQAYSDPKREKDPHALPDIEIFLAPVATCPVCGNEYPGELSDERAGHSRATGDSCCHGVPYHLGDAMYWYWYCFPGCMPDSDPVGPFRSEKEALADAREGLDDDDEGREG